jgi:hypothetical protein
MECNNQAAQAIVRVNYNLADPTFCVAKVYGQSFENPAPDQRLFKVRLRKQMSPWIANEAKLAIDLSLSMSLDSKIGHVLDQTRGKKLLFVPKGQGR